MAGAVGRLAAVAILVSTAWGAEAPLPPESGVDEGPGELEAIRREVARVSSALGSRLAAADVAVAVRAAQRGLVWESLPGRRLQSNASNTTNTNTTTTSTCPPSFTGQCCTTEIPYEASVACKELKKWQVTDLDQQTFANSAQIACQAYCGDCTEISNDVFSQCLFLLAFRIGLGIDPALPFCNDMRMDFLDLRCPTACFDKNEVCSRPAINDCNRLCGNYKPCDCFRHRGMMGAPDVCEGKTVLKGFIEGTNGLLHNCILTPDICKNHWAGRQCGPYKHCPQDFCVVRSVTCPMRDSCETAGVCNPSDGECYYSYKPDGAECDDGLFYTYQDTCAGGRCIGIVDKCSRDNVSCITANPCLYENGTCDPDAGQCRFVRKPDGATCGSASGAALVSGQCQSGLCRRTHRDLCWNAVCPDLGECFENSTCDSRHGVCSRVPRAEGTSCNGTKPGSVCIDGVCVSPQFAGVHFQASEDCSSRETAGQARYLRQLSDPNTCQAQCAQDPACTSYSHGYHVCTIYGSARSRAPNMDWIFSEIPVDVRYALACQAKAAETKDKQDPLRSKREAYLRITLGVLIALPSAWFVYKSTVVLASCKYGNMLRRAVRRILGRHPSPPQPPQSGPSPLTLDYMADSPKGNSKVASTPVMALERGELEHAAFAAENPPLMELSDAPPPSAPKAALKESGGEELRDPRGQVEPAS